jgi:hypothetical protein
VAVIHIRTPKGGARWGKVGQGIRSQCVFCKRKQSAFKVTFITLRRPKIVVRALFEAKDHTFQRRDVRFRCLDFFEINFSKFPTTQHLDDFFIYVVILPNFWQALAQPTDHLQKVNTLNRPGPVIKLNEKQFIRAQRVLNSSAASSKVFDFAYSSSAASSKVFDFAYSSDYLFQNRGRVIWNKKINKSLLFSFDITSKFSLKFQLKQKIVP